MNVFFVFKDKVLTPDLKSETILAGVTRDTVITLLKELGHTVVEGQVNIEEIIAAYKKGELLEVFGTGTAATIAMIRELRYKDFSMDFDTDTWKVCTSAKKRLDAIRSLELPDPQGWMFKV
jgi:branched-chain amino acid aminotransferase